MTLTYPKAAKLTVGHDPKEDRLFLIFHLQDGGFRKAFLSRRMLGALLVRMSEELASSHPMAGYTAQRDEMLQMEHVASVSKPTQQGTGQVSQTSKSKPPDTHAEPPKPAKALRVPTTFAGVYYVTSAHLEIQHGELIVAFSGDYLNDNTGAHLIAALAMPRNEAHQVLRLLRDKAEFAGWNMDAPAQWLKPLEYGKALGVQ